MKRTGYSVLFATLASIVAGCGSPPPNDGAEGSSAAESNFLLTCYNWKMPVQNELHATCYDVQGHPHNSSIDPNTCIMNKDGQLTWRRSGNYDATCQSCDITDSSLLSCSCRTIKGTWSPTTINLNSGISNINGKLQCDVRY